MNTKSCSILAILERSGAEGSFGSVHRDWQREISPGFFFLRFAPEEAIAIYGEVLSYAKEPGYVETLSYIYSTAQGFKVKTHKGSIPFLLSKEQFDLAKRYGYPSRPNLIDTIFQLPQT